MYCYRAAGENLELARAELEGFLESQGLDTDVEKKGRVFLSAAEPPTGQLRRLALFHEAGELVYRGPEEDFTPDLMDFSSSFRIDAHAGKGTESRELEKKLGEMLDSPERDVDLENPSVVFDAYRLDGELLLARRLEEIDRGLFGKRSNEERPFSSPVSLDPVLARVLVNLTGAEPGSSIIDPLCGTGGILLEAGLCGIGVQGCDLDPEMVRGARKNLEEYGVIVHDIRECDFRESPSEFGSADYLVADLPYGRASKTEGEMEELVEVAEDLGVERAVLVYNEPEFAGMDPSFELPVHRSLTRYIFLYDLS
jgi:tRNA (guanine10-N2)-dimethyltransferase